MRRNISYSLIEACLKVERPSKSIMKDVCAMCKSCRKLRKRIMHVRNPTMFYSHVNKKLKTLYRVYTLEKKEKNKHVTGDV